MRNDRGRRDVRGRAERGGPGRDARAVSSWRSASSWLMNTSVSSCVMNTCPCEGLPGTGETLTGPQPRKVWAQGSTGSDSRAGLGAPATRPLCPGKWPPTLETEQGLASRPCCLPRSSLQGLYGHPALGPRTLRPELPT